MGAEAQQIAALAVVALAALGLVLRHRIRRKTPGCASECSCPAQKLRR